MDLHFSRVFPLDGVTLFICKKSIFGKVFRVVTNFVLFLKGETKERKP